MVMVIDESRLCHIVAELAVGQRLRLHAHINARLIQRQRIKGSEHADIGQNGRVVLGVAVAVRRNILNQRDMEARAPGHHSLGVFRHAPVQERGRVIADKLDRIVIAGAEAASAAHAVRLIHAHLFGLPVVHEPAVGTGALAETAAAADLLVDLRLPGAVLRADGYETEWYRKD